MNKIKISVLVLLLFFSMNIPIHASEKQTSETKEYTLTIPLLPEGNYYTTITDDNCIMTLEVLDPTDNSAPINVDEINTRALGNEEFSQGNYTRTLRYYEIINPTTPIPVEFIAEWQVKFTVYVGSTYPKITYVSGFIETEGFPSLSGPYLRRAQASSSLPAYAEALLRNTSDLTDGYNRYLYMAYYLYGDDSGTAEVNMIKNMN